MVLLAALFFWAGPASACSCAIIDPAVTADQSEVVFVGTLDNKQPFGQGPVGGQDLFLFTVDTVLKGDVAPEIGVVSANNGAACGIESPIGQRLAVFAYQEEGLISSNLCSVTDPDTAIKSLGVGWAPTEGGNSGSLSGTESEGGGFDWAAVGLGVGGVGVVAGAWLLERRRWR
jgi:hypothetical protein